MAVASPKPATEPSPAQNLSLTMVRTFNAPPARVFQAWTHPETMSRWFCPGDMAATVTADARVGGRYRVEMKNPDGSTHTVSGEYLEIQANRRILKTWQWEGSPNLMHVAVDLREKSPGITEMTLTHTRLPEEDARNKHEHGWTGCFAKLEKLFA